MRRLSTSRHPGPARPSAATVDGVALTPPPAPSSRGPYVGDKFNPIACKPYHFFRSIPHGLTFRVPRSAVRVRTHTSYIKLRLSQATIVTTPVILTYLPRPYTRPPRNHEKLFSLGVAFHYYIGHA